jgi:hypothetical protein
MWGCYLNRGQNCPTNQIRKTNHNMAENGKKDMQPVGLEPTPLFFSVFRHVVIGFPNLICGAVLSAIGSFNFKL